MKVQLGDREDAKPFTIDVDKLIETRLLVQGSSGSGKTRALRKLLEETHGKLQHLVIDPEGELVTLREKFDYVVVGHDGDVPADPGSAELLAHRLMELNASAILDVSELEHDDQQEFVHLFLKALIRTPKDLQRPCLVVVDEVQKFAPLNVATDAAKAVIDLAARGRKRELCLVPATQRISKVHKDVVAECLNKFIGRTTLDLDVKRAADELGFAKKDFPQLRALVPGEFFAYGPAIAADVERMKMGEVRTRHGKEARAKLVKKPTPTAKVRAALAKLADLQKEAETDAQDREALQKRVRELERELKAAGGVTPEKREELVRQGYEKGRAEVTKLMNQFKNRLQQKLAEIGAIVAAIPDTTGAVAQASHTATAVRTGTLPFSRLPPSQIPARENSPAAQNLTSPAKINHAPRPVAAGERKLDRCARAILNLLANRPGQAFTQAQLGGFTEYSVTSSSFANALSALRSAGLIRGSQEIALAVSKEQAIEVLGADYDRNFAPSLEGWKSKLDKAPRTFFTILLENAGHVLSKEQLAELSGYSVTSSSFANAISELCSKKLAERAEGGIRFNQELLEMA